MQVQTHVSNTGKSVLVALFCTVIWGFFEFTFASTALAKTSLEDIRDKLSRREVQLSNCAFTWSVHYVQQRKPMDAKLAAKLQTQVSKQAAQRASSAGISDAKRREAFVNARVSQVLYGVQHPREEWDADWEFCRNGDSLAAHGTFVGGTTNLALTNYYLGKLGVIVNERAADRNNSGEIVPMSTTVWRTSGNAMKIAPPLDMGLCLRPEDYAFLIASDPLSFAFSKWTVSMRPDGSYFAQTSLPSGMPEPIRIEAVLDPHMDYAPSRIRVIRKVVVSEYRVLAFAKYHDEWVASKFEKTDRASFFTRTLAWTLKGIAPSKQIMVKIPRRQVVEDTRLLGTDLTTVAYQRAQGRRDPDVVFYESHGAIAPLSQLPALRDSHRPMAFRFLPSTLINLVMLVLGTALTVIGLIWRSRRSRSSHNREAASSLGSADGQPTAPRKA